MNTKEFEDYISFLEKKYDQYRLYKSKRIFLLETYFKRPEQYKKLSFNDYVINRSPNYAKYLTDIPEQNFKKPSINFMGIGDFNNDYLPDIAILTKHNETNHLSIAILENNNTHYAPTNFLIETKNFKTIKIKNSYKEGSTIYYLEMFDEIKKEGLYKYIYFDPKTHTYKNRTDLQVNNSPTTQPLK